MLIQVTQLNRIEIIPWITHDSKSEHTQISTHPKLRWNKNNWNCVGVEISIEFALAEFTLLNWAKIEEVQWV